MRYEDASGAFQASGPIANDDSDTLSAGQRGPATGNLITGEGTQYGASGADIAAGAHITAIAGKGGEDESFSGGKLSVAGEHGRLTVDADGNYSYLANGNVENVRDRFTYTLADSAGNSDTAALIVEIGKTPAVIKANAQQIVPGPDGVVTLPPGVELSDVHVVGRNLVVDLPDGTQLVIIDGAIFVPQLALNGVEVPATNVAALLVGQEVQPAAGEIPPSSGGNFALPPPPLDPGVPLGDLIPPTELNYIPPEPQEVLDILDRDPEIFVQPDGQPASVAAVDQVEEAGLPTPRNGNLPIETAGSGESADGNGADNDVTTETTAGTILINSPDGVDSVTINNVLVTGAIGQTIGGAFGTLTITGFSGDDILYSYTLRDNTSGNSTHDDFSVVLTDPDGDVASATLRIDIIDDVPTARPDTDSIAAGQFGPALGNVITDASAGDAGDSDSGADTVGADNASVTAVSSVNVPANSDSSSPFVVNGQYGVLTLQADGSYSYIRNQGTPGGVNDVFNYTLTDGDGDTSSTTLTISIGDLQPQLGDIAVLIDDDALPGGLAGGIGDGPDAVNVLGAFGAIGGDGPLTFSVQLTGAPAGFAFVSGGTGVVLLQQNGVTVRTLTFDPATGSYSVTQNAPILHPAGGEENDLVFVLTVTVTDADGDTDSGTITITVDDDTPIANDDVDTMPDGSNGPETGNVITGAGTDGGLGGAGADSAGADGGAAIVGLASNNVPANVDNNAAGGFVVLGQYGTLTMQADGSYSYTRTDGSPVGDVTDVFTYTLTDADGDTTTATLTLNISDDGPETGENPLVRFDDDALPGGNPGGTGDDAPDTVNAAGTLSGSGGNGTLTFAVQTSGAPAGFTYVSGGPGVVLIQQGGVTVLTVTVGSDGSYSVVQNAPIDHVAGSDENNQLFTINYTVTDADGDSAGGSFQINVDDDTPIALEAQVTGIVDEDGVPGGIAGGVGDVAGENNVATGSVASLFAPGADTPLSFGFADNAIAILEGLGLTSNGVALDYVIAGNTVTASTAAGDVFTFELNANGSWEFTLLDQLDHADGNNENDLTINLGSIIEATDADGDSVTAFAGGLVITVDDDTPTASSNHVTGLVDEDGVVEGAADSGDGDGIAGGIGDVPGAPTVASGSVASMFNTGADAPLSFGFAANAVTVLEGLGLTSGGDALDYVVLGNTVTASTAAGDVFTFELNDNGSWEFTLIDQLDHADGLDENDLAINLGAIIQATDADGDSVVGNADGLVITVDDDTPVARNDEDTVPSGGDIITGNVITGANTDTGAAGSDDTGADEPASVTGLASDNIPANSDNDPAGGGFVVLGEFGQLTMQPDGSYSYDRFGGSPGDVDDIFTYTYTDADGDSVTATLTIHINDSAPTLIPPPAALVDDDDVLGAGGNPGGTGDDAPANTSGNLSVVAGTGDGDIDFFFSAVQPALPGGFSHNLVNSTTMQILQGATVVLTITLDNETGAYSIVQNNPVDHAAGGDENNLGPLNVGLVAIDEGGTGDASNVVNLSITVDDDTPTVSANLAAQLDDDALAGGNPGGTGDVNPDTANLTGTLGHSFGADGAGSIAFLTTGAPAGFTYELSGGDLLIKQGTTTVITVTLNSTTGAYTITQNNPIDHAAGGNENDVAFTLTYRVTDGDNDPADGSLVINVDDDTPTVSANAAVQLDDDALAGGNPGGTGDVNPDTANLSGTLGHSFGADGAGSVAYLTTGAPAGFTYELSGSDLLIKQGTTTVITLTVNPTTGAYTVTQNNPIDHATGLDENDVAFTVNYRVTDGDNDTVDGSILINVDDDTPTVSANAAVQLDDDALAGGNPGGTGDVNPDTANLTGTLGHSFGADGAGSVAYLTTGAPAGFTYELSGSDLLIKQGTTTVITLTVNPTTGAYTVTQNAPILHAAGGNENDAAFTINYQVTDGDGDTASGSMVINVDDDTPTLGTIQNQEASNIAGDPVSIGTLHYSNGADTPASVTAITANNTGVTSGGFNLVTNVAGNVLTAYQDVNGNGTYEALTDVTAVYTLTVNPSAGTSGQYVFDLLVPLDPTVTETAIGGSSSFGAGPTGFQILQSTVGGQDLAVLSGYLIDETLANADPNDSDTDGVFNFNTWFTTGVLVSGDIASAGTNGSVSGWGVDNNNFENTNELMFFDFGSQATSDPDAGGPFVPPDQAPDDPDPAPEVQMPNISTATFEFINYTSGAGNAGDDISYVVHYTDGSFDSGWIPDNAIDGDVQWKFTADAGKFIADIQFFAGANPDGSVQDLPPGKVDLVSVGVQSSSLTETIGFNVTISDADGDTVSGAFSVEVADGNTPLPPAAMEALPSSKGGSGSLLAADDDGGAASFVYSSSELQKQSFGNIGNTGITSAMVAASGFAMMSTTSLTSFSQPSFDSMVQHGFQSINTQMAGREGVDGGLASISFGGELGHSAVDMVALSSSIHSFTDDSFGGRGLDAMSFAEAAPAYVPNYASGEPTVANIPAFAADVPSVSMASAEMLRAAVNLDGNVQHGGAVEQVLAEALGNHAPTIDAVLANLPGGIAELAVIANLASPDGAGVPAWDMMGHGAFGPAPDMVFKVEAVMIHQDAVQPA